MVNMMLGRTDNSWYPSAEYTRGSLHPPSAKWEILRRI